MSPYKDNNELIEDTKKLIFKYLVNIYSRTEKKRERVLKRWLKAKKDGREIKISNPIMVEKILNEDDPFKIPACENITDEMIKKGLIRKGFYPLKSHYEIEGYLIDRAKKTEGKVPKICPWCELEFYPERSNQIYHSKSCRNMASRKRRQKD